MYECTYRRCGRKLDENLVTLTNASCLLRYWFSCKGPGFTKNDTQDSNICNSKEGYFAENLHVHSTIHWEETRGVDCRVNLKPVRGGVSDVYLSFPSLVSSISRCMGAFVNG